MFKTKYGPITNFKTGASKDIIVNFCNSKNVKHILISGGIMLVGMTYLAISTFKTGSDAFENAEFTTLKDLGLIVEK